MKTGTPARSSVCKTRRPRYGWRRELRAGLAAGIVAIHACRGGKPVVFVETCGAPGCADCGRAGSPDGGSRHRGSPCQCQGRADRDVFSRRELSQKGAGPVPHRSTALCGRVTVSQSRRGKSGGRSGNGTGPATSRECPIRAARGRSESAEGQPGRGKNEAPGRAQGSAGARPGRSHRGSVLGFGGGGGRARDGTNHHGRRPRRPPAGSGQSVPRP